MREGWTETTLGELCTLTKGASPTLKTLPGDYPLIVTGPDPLSSNDFQFDGEAVCIPMVSSTGHGHASLKRVHYASGKFAVANIITAAEVRNPDEAITRFLWLYLQHYRDDLIVTRMKGTANVSLSQKALATVPLQFPPLDEQQRIDNLVGAVDDAIEAAENQRASVDAVLDGLAERLLFSGSERCQVPVSDLAEKRGLIGGPFGSSLVSRDYVESGVPIIRGTNMPKSGRYVWGDFAYVSEAKAESLRRNHAIPGDVIFTQRGTLGQVGLVPAEGPPKYVISQSQMRLRVNDELVTADYIYHVFRSTRMVGRIKALNTATANPHINLGILAKIDIPLPPLDEQAAICSTLDSVQAAAGEAQQFADSLHTLRSELLTALLSGTHEIPDTYDEVMSTVA